MNGVLDARGDRVTVDDLRVYCIIGLHPWERRAPQEVRISLSLAVNVTPAASSGQLADTIDYSKLAEAAASLARHGRYELLESLACALAELSLQYSGVLEVQVTVRKTAAIRDASAAVVQVVRRRRRPDPRLLGVLNLSPESRVTPSVAADGRRIRQRAARLRADGCELIELGARSTNPAPGTRRLSDTEEIERLRPAVQSLASEGFRVAVETWSSVTALWALDAGAAMIDFTNAVLPDEVCRHAGERGAALVLVHLPYGHPERMKHSKPISHLYPNGSTERIASALSARADSARAAGAGEVYLDPNTGIVHPALDEYLKVEQQMQAIAVARSLEDRGYPVLINCPRKESLTSRIILSHLLLEARPTWIRTHDPEIISAIHGIQPTAPRSAAPAWPP